MKYLFTYSGQWEGFRRFNKIHRLLKLIQIIPDWELPKTVVMKKVKDVFFVGQYRKLKNGKITVKF